MTRRRLGLGDIVHQALRDMERTDWRKVLMSEPCVYCGGVAQGLDHIVARSVGGADTVTINRAPACTPCDGRKGNVTMLLFLATRKGLRIMPRESGVAKPDRQKAERAARQEMRRQYREANEISFRDGTFGQQLMDAIDWSRKRNPENS